MSPMSSAEGAGDSVGSNSGGDGEHSDTGAPEMPSSPPEAGGGEGVDDDQDDDGAAAATSSSSTASSNARDLRESERLLFFTDAVVAIALTLLILPLMEEAASFGTVEEGESGSGGEGSTGEGAETFGEERTAGDFFRDHGNQIGAFVLSFFMVFDDFWKSHAFLFTYVDRVSIALHIANMVWILGLIFVPIATSLLINSTGGVDATLFYVGIIWANKILLLVMKILIRRDQRTWSEENGCPTKYSLVRSIVSVGIGAVTMVLGGIFAQWGLFSLILYQISTRLIMPLILKCCPQVKRTSTDVAHDYYLRAGFVATTRIYVYRKVKACIRTNDSTVVAGSQRVEEKEEPSNNSELASIENMEEPDSATSTNGMLGHKSFLLQTSDRLIIFTDATVAISMTLLIIPLMELSSELEGETASEYFAENSRLIGSLILSFFIIARLWYSHDSRFVFIEGHVPAEFMLFTLPWLLSITFLPVATSLLQINDDFSDRSKYGIYIGTITFNLIMGVAFAFIVYCENKDFPRRRIVSSIVAVILSALGLLIAMLVPSTGYFMPLLILLTRPITSLLLMIWPNVENLVVKMA